MGAGQALVIIPARLDSTRLPYKPLAQIGSRMLVEHVWKRCVDADVGPVWVSTDSNRAVDAIQSLGGNALYRAHLAENCGTDRVLDAARVVDPECRFDTVINVQGDMPFISPSTIRLVYHAVSEARPYVTVRCRTGHVACKFGTFARFAFDQHIGIYGFTRQALEDWSKLPLSFHQKAESLEQFRIVDAGLDWHFVDVDQMPLEINTPNDLMNARYIADCLAS